MKTVVILFWRFAIAIFLILLAILTGIARRLRHQAALAPQQGLVVVLTGTFYTDNWIKTHLVPLAQCDAVSQVYMVASTAVPQIEGVTPVYPNPRSEKLLGRTLARLWTFARTCRSKDADVVGGFHLLVNGLIAQLVAAMSGKRSLYFCGGGVREVEGGGYQTQNKLFMKLRYASPLIERLLVRAAGSIDIVVTMGTSVRQYFLARGAKGIVVVIPGGFDTDEFCPPPDSVDKAFDLVTVGRVSDVKRLDIFVEVVVQLTSKGVRAMAVIVGDGPLLESLRKDVNLRDMEQQVTFAGWQTEVAPWLQCSRVFLLTSESEGLSQALIQAMLCGLPAVVTDVGDLSDLVVDGENGFLIPELDAAAFVQKLEPLIANPAQLQEFSKSARASAVRLSNERISQTWTQVFNNEI